MDLRQHLNGPILCEGVIYGPTGRVSSSFVADFDARWDGNVGRMTEHFRYDSGSTQDREWHLLMGTDGGSGDAIPFRIIPERGQVPEHDMDSPSKESCNVFHENISGSYLTDQPCHFRP